MIGIYKISHTPSGEYYIGSSSNINRRFAEHRYKFTHLGKFDCGWVTEDKDITHYEFEVLCECTLDELHYKEVEYIKGSDPVKCHNVRADDEKCNRTPNSMSGKHWYTNGTETIACYDDDAPEGWYRGRSNGKEGITDAPKDNIRKGTAAYEKFLMTRTRYQNYIDTECMDIQILSNGEFVPLNGILVNSVNVSNPLCEVRYNYKGISTRALALTTDHPLVTGRGRVKVEDLVPGDVIYDSNDGAEYKITEIVPIDRKSVTYDVETDNDVFDLSGILSHNCRTRVIGNINGPEQTTARGNFAFHTINLPRLAIESHIETKDIEKRKELFFQKLDGMLEDAKGSLLDRFQFICKTKTYENYPFTMQQGLYLTAVDKEHDIHDSIAEVMKQRHCRIVGTITQHLLDMRVGRPDIDELIVVDTMAERKKILEDMADAFIAMPGGVGTMDEFFEVMVLSQLRVFDKPVALFNVNGYYDHIVSFLDRATHDGFIHREHADNLIVSDDPQALLEGIENFKPVELKKWVSEIKEQAK